MQQELVWPSNLPYHYTWRFHRDIKLYRKAKRNIWSEIPVKFNKKLHLVEFDGFWLIWLILVYFKLGFYFGLWGRAMMSDLNCILVWQCNWVQLWFVVWWLDISAESTPTIMDFWCWVDWCRAWSAQHRNPISTISTFLTSSASFKSPATTQIERWEIIIGVGPLCPYDCNNVN